MYGYDLRDRLKILIYPDGRKLEYEYDGNGNRKTVKATIGTTVSTSRYTYDDANRLDLVTDPVGRVRTTMATTPTAIAARLAYPNGTLTAYTYNDLNRLTQSRDDSSVGRRHRSRPTRLRLAPSGNRTKITEPTERSASTVTTTFTA